MNCEGRAQSFNGVVRPLGDTRPGWKVLRVLGNLTGVAGFDFDSSEAVRDAALSGNVESKMYNAISDVAVTAGAASAMQRIADVPIYFTDALVRHAESLQRTRDAQTPKAWMPFAILTRAGVAAGDKVKVKQGSAEAVLEAALDNALPANCVRVSAGHPATAGLGAMSGAMTVERA